VAKAVLGLPTTSMLIERFAVDRQLRRLCGWEHPGQVPSEATFSRAFAEFARGELPGRMHEALIKRSHKDRLRSHLARRDRDRGPRKAGEDSGAAGKIERTESRPLLRWSATRRVSFWTDCFASGSQE
jgi:hypothetical protein